jgi:hypothetical protein
MKLHTLNGLVFAMLLLLGVMSQRAAAQTETQSITNLKHRVSNVEQHTSDAASGGAIAFLFGAFCALWAQNTGRGPWLWFFLGLLFSVITVLVLLYKNSNDKRQVQRLTASQG